MLYREDLWYVTLRASSNRYSPSHLVYCPKHYTAYITLTIMTTANKIFSAFSFIGFWLCWIPFRRHMLGWNTAICLNLVWAATACLMYFVDSVIWNDNDHNSAPIWCDITSHLHIYATIAMPMASSILNYRIYAMTLGKAPSTIEEKRRALMFDLALGIGIPAIVVILSYIAQESRFLILGDFGCYPAVSFTPVSQVLVHGPPMLISWGGAVYAVLTVRLVYKRYSELNELLASNGNGIDRGLYARIVIYAVTGSVCLVPLGLYASVSNWIQVTPWQGMKQEHADISIIYQIPARVWRSDSVSQVKLEISRWEFVFSAFLMFLIIGINGELLKNYVVTTRQVFQYILLCRRVKQTATNRDGPKDPQPKKGGLLPLVFARQPVRRLKFLDFSPNKSRVIADVNGGLPQTQNSAFHSVTTSGDYRAENVNLTSHQESVVATTSIDSEV